MTSSRSAFPDLLITIPAILLLFLGVLVIYSSSPKLAMQQSVLAIIGFGIYFLLSKVDFEFYGEYFKYMYIGIIGLLLVVFVLGIESRGSIRWIPIGSYVIQPSEIAKPVMILLLANFWVKRFPTVLNIVKSFLLISPAFLLIFRQPDLGTSLTIAAIWITTLIGANLSLFKMAVMSLFSLIMMPLSWHFLKDYQRERIISFLSPQHDPLGSGYNVIQSTIAVGSGQVLGRGLGRGTQSRLQFLPEFRTDFIFASYAEEFGFLGSLIVLSLYGLILFRSISIITGGVSRFNTILVYGVLGMVFFQTAVNIGMNIGVAPVTGITLPLISYGGSSLISTLICLSFIASTARSKSSLGY